MDLTFSTTTIMLENPLNKHSMRHLMSIQICDFTLKIIKRKYDTPLHTFLPSSLNLPLTSIQSWLKPVTSLYLATDIAINNHFCL